MPGITVFDESLKAYFGKDATDTYEVGKHIQEQFKYCPEHMIFYNFTIVHPICPMCAHELDYRH